MESIRLHPRWADDLASNGAGSEDDMAASKLSGGT